MLTISPGLLSELSKCTTPVSRNLDQNEAKKQNLEKVHLDEAKFRFLLNEDQMATEKLSDGIRKFSADARKLEIVLANLVNDAK